MNSFLQAIWLAAFFFSLLITDANAQLKGFAFLRTTIGARAAAMGGAYTAMRNDVRAIASNPALLAGFSRRIGAFDYTNHFLDIQSGFGAYLHPMKQANMAVSLFFQDYGNFSRMDEFGNEVGAFSANSFILTAAYARKYNEQIWFGGSVKYFRSAIDNYTADGFAIDLGMYIMTSIFDNLQIGGGVFNLGTARTAFISTKESLPTRVELGLSKRLAHLPLEWSLALQQYMGEKLQFAVGGEFTISENMFLRLGYNSLGKDQKIGASEDRFAGVSLGLGLAHKNYQFDYSFSSFGIIGSQNRFSFSVQF